MSKLGRRAVNAQQPYRDSETNKDIPLVPPPNSKNPGIIPPFILDPL